ncbi:MAG: histidine phosphatase family protein [Kordiimonadaceae bacterium]|nr:histidine phosphatase family protein [Kordiimonadaceae bacterium]
MKKLFLLRHAKSDWVDFTVEDHDRPLNDRGRKAAQALGKYLNRNKINPSYIYCSTSERTRETLAIVQQTAATEWPVHYDVQLYGASAHQLLKTLQNTDNSYDSVMVVGHNPGLEGLAKTLTATDKFNLLPSIQHKVPTGSLITLSFKVDTFSKVCKKEGYLESFLRPKIELEPKTSD